MAFRDARYEWPARPRRCALVKRMCNGATSQRMVTSVETRPRTVAASRHPAALALALAALTIGLIFAVALILPMPFWHAQPAAPTPGQSSVTDLGWPAALLALGFALALSVPFRPYALAITQAARGSGRSLLLLTAGLALIALAIYPAFGSDLFVYLDYERLWAVYTANPLLSTPDLHPEDWSFAFVWMPQQPSPYGPLWPIITWPIAKLAGESLWGWIVGYKLLSLICYVTCCGLIWATVSPERRKRALVVFAWSPLVLFEVLGKAHNDSLLAVAALAAVWLARRHPTLGLLVAAAGMLVKLSGFALVLGLAVVLARKRAWRQLAFGIAAAFGLSAALYAPFWVGPATLEPVLIQTSRVVWSPGALLIGAAGAAQANIGLLARALTAVAWAVICGVVARRGAGLARDTSVLLLATLLLLTTAFFAHYLVPVVALAAVAGSRPLERMTIALSIGGLCAYSVELLAEALPPGWIGSSGYQVLGSVVTLAPGAALLLLWMIRSTVLRTSRAAPDWPSTTQPAPAAS
jgi:hypothetical protein